jgi:hypothetical protein
MNQEIQNKCQEIPDPVYWLKRWLTNPLKMWQVQILGNDSNKSKFDEEIKDQITSG